MRQLLSLLLSAVLVLALPACGSTGGTSDSQPDPVSASSDGTSQEPVVIPFSLAVYPAYSLHPVLGENRANLTLAPLLYEPLFQLDENFQAVPVLCQRPAGVIRMSSCVCLMKFTKNIRRHIFCIWHILL